jgi:glycosyltransferase-like protein
MWRSVAVKTVRARSRRGSIALFTYSTLPRGSVVHTAALADALVDAGWEATVYALDKDGRGFFRPLRAHLRLVPAAPAPATTSALVRLRAAELATYLARHAPAHDVHHAQDCLSANGLLAARAAGSPVTLARTVHHVERFEDADLAACQERSIREAALCLSVSEAARRDVAAIFGVDAPVVGNGVDARRFRAVDAARLAAVRARLGAAGPVVLAVGGVEGRKNSTRILLAFARLRARHPGARLWILGGATVLDHGAARAEFDRARDALPADARRAVLELGVVPDADVPAIFRLADVLATPSLHEGFGLVALEAMAAGLPVVASAAPPFTELLDDSCATLVDPRSVDAIAAGLARALDAPPGVRRAARARARTYDWARVAALHARHYERMIARAGDALHRSLA